MSQKEAHYENLVNRYDGIPMLSDERTQIWTVQQLKKLMSIDLNKHKCVDIGAGTCRIALLMTQSKDVAQPITCVEPSSLIDTCEVPSEIRKLRMDALEFSAVRDIRYDRVWMTQVVHHLGDNMLTVFKNIRQQLNEGGMMCIDTRPMKCDYPWFQAATDAWNSMDENHIVDTLNHAGYLDVQMLERSLEHIVPVEDWIEMIRMRFFSNLALLTNDDIEEGIHEMKTDLLNGEDVVRLNDKHLFIVAKK